MAANLQKMIQERALLDATLNAVLQIAAEPGIPEIDQRMLTRLLENAGTSLIRFEEAARGA